MAAAPSAPLHVKGPPEAAAPTLSNRIPDARTALRRVLEDQQQRSQRRIFHVGFVKILFAYDAQASLHHCLLAFLPAAIIVGSDQPRISDLSPYMNLLQGQQITQSAQYANKHCAH